ncbi:hypothetical protein ANO14919_121730 [Xylariales sp. No.14919]|nr:hypothetical protein ANO14919_121730 [Xylariales sp. No.14919]
MALGDKRFFPVAASTASLVFFGTPHRALDGASWINLACSLLVISKTKTPENPPKTIVTESIEALAATLRRINQEFREISRAYQIISVYEEERLIPPAPVIDTYSATYGTTNEWRCCLRKTHSELSKLSTKVQEEQELLECIVKRATNSHKPPAEYFRFLRILYSLGVEPNDPSAAARELTTFEWLEQNPAYQEWRRAGSNNILCIQGKECYDRSTLASDIANVQLGKHAALDEEQISGSSGTEVISFTFDTKDKTRRTTFAMFATLNYQLLCRRPELFSHVERISGVFINANTSDERSKLRVDRLWVLFRTLVSCPEHGGVICVLNSIDKCDPSGNKFLEEYMLLWQSLPSAPRLVVTSLNGTTISGNVPNVAVIDLDSVVEYRADVNKFVQLEVERLIKRRPAFTKFIERIKTLLDSGSTTLGAAKLTLEILYQIQVPSTARGIGQALTSMSSKLDDLYDEMMSINQERNSVWGQRVLSWMMHAIRPLTVPEMSLALALGENDHISSFHEIQDEIAEDLTSDLDRAFRGLVRVQDGQVQFIHDAFREYLLRKHRGECSTSCLLCVDHHPMITRLCLIYISLMNNEIAMGGEDGPGENKNSLTDLEAGPASANVPRDSFLAYAVMYWPIHYRKARATSNKQTPLNFDVFFDIPKLMDAWADRFWDSQNPLTRGVKDTLYIAAGVGCSDLVAKLLDPNRPGMPVRSASNALAIAIENGHADLVDETLKQATHGEALHIAASHGRVELFRILKGRPCLTIEGSSEYTTLQNAAESGNASVVEEILRDYDEPQAASLVNAIGGLGETALHEASRFGHIDVMKRLLKHADPNIASSEWKTPLHLACLWQQPSAVGVLLSEQRIRLDTVDGNKRTALHFAADAGRIDIVKRILNWYTDEMVKSEALHMKDDEGRTPLHLAALHGHEKVVQEILESETGPPELAGVIDESGSVPLHLAIESGALNVVEKLLERSSKQISSTDRSRNIPIHLAVSRGYTMIVESLCKKHSELEASLDVFNDKSLTPLHLACENGFTDIVEILLNHHAEAEITGPNGETPLLAVCRKGYDDILPLLLDCFADAMRIDDNGSSPLHLAAGGGNDASVWLLLGHGVRVDQKDGKGRVPAHLAAHHGHQGVIEILLDYGADPMISDASGRSLLHYACEGGNRALVEFLINILGADALYNLDNNNQTLLHAAAGAGEHDIVELLLDKGANPNPSDDKGQTPLDLATDQGVIKLLLQTIPTLGLDEGELGSILLSSAEKGHDGVARILLPRSADPNIVNAKQQTPLHLAALGGHAGIADLLLAHSEIEPDKPDNNCRTPLSYAAERGSSEIVRSILRQAPKVDSNSKDNSGQTPLHFSAEQGHVEVVREILQSKETLRSKTKDIVFIDPKNGDGVTPLWLAATKGHHEVVTVLLSGGADPSVTDTAGSTPLHCAALNGWPKVSKAILESKKLENGDARDGEGRTALYLAAYYGHAETFSILISSPVGLDSKIVGPYGWRPLHAAYDCLPIIRLILKHVGNSEIDCADRYGKSTLHLSIENGFETVARELLHNGADPLKAAADGMTPLHQAAKRKGATFFRFVLNKIPASKDVNIKNDGGETPFLLAVQMENLDAVKALLQRDNFSVQAFDSAGIRTIGRVIETGNTEIFTILIQDRQRSTLLADMSDQETGKLVLEAFKTGNEKMCNSVLDNLSNAKATSDDVFDLVAAEQPSLARLLLDKGVDPGKVDKHGWPLPWIHFVYEATQQRAVNPNRDAPATADFKEPSSWNPEDKHSSLELVEESGKTLGVRCWNDAHTERDERYHSEMLYLGARWRQRARMHRRFRSYGCVRADHPVPPDRKWYFEVKIISMMGPNKPPRRQATSSVPPIRNFHYY